MIKVTWNNQGANIKISTGETICVLKFLYGSREFIEMLAKLQKGKNEFYFEEIPNK